MNQSGYPTIAVVTPSFNQAEYLEKTIQSVLDQRYPSMEFIIIDGGSTDGSVDIIRKYEKHLTHWESGPDRGQSHAINKGLMRARSEWVAWQNSDDVYLPDAFHSMARAIRKNPDAEFVIGNIIMLDELDQIIRDVKYVVPTYRSILAEGMVLTNQAAIWRRSLHSELGYLSENLHYGFDYEWFLRLTGHGIKTVHVNETWAGFRVHSRSKSSTHNGKMGLEYESILAGRKPSVFTIRVYQLRRLMLLLSNGNLWYVLRGITRRLHLAITRKTNG